MDEVVETPVEEQIPVSGVVEVSQDEINAAVAELAKKQDEIKNKFYLIEGGKEYGEKLRAFIITDIKWTFGQAIGICKLEEAVSAALKKIEIGETAGKFYMLGIELVALHMLLKSTEGKGIHAAKKFRDIIEPLNNTLGTSVKADEEVINRLEFQISSWKQGIQPAEEVMDGIDVHDRNEM